MRETLKKIQSRIKSKVAESYIDEIGAFIICWIIIFDLVGGTMIPIAYKHGCGWFAIPNLIIDICVIITLVKQIKK